MLTCVLDTAPLTLIGLINNNNNIIIIIIIIIIISYKSFMVFLRMFITTDFWVLFSEFLLQLSPCNTLILFLSTTRTLLMMLIYKWYCSSSIGAWVIDTEGFIWVSSLSRFPVYSQSSENLFQLRWWLCSSFLVILVAIWFDLTSVSFALINMLLLPATRVRQHESADNPSVAWRIISSVHNFTNASF